MATAAAAFVLLAAACNGPASLLAGKPRLAASVTPGSGNGQTAGITAHTNTDTVADTHGSLAVTVRWPGPRVQVLPDSAVSLEFRILGATGAGVLASRRLTRAGEATSGVRIERLPIGEVRLEAAAFNSFQERVAQGTASARVLPSSTTACKLSMQPLDRPRVTGFSPANGGPGSTVRIAGYFGPASVPVAVFFGGIPVPVNRVQRTAPGEIAVEVPAGATTSPIVVVADGVRAPSQEAFVTIGSITLSPASAGLAAGATQSFSAVAADTDGQPVASPSLAWTVTDVVGGAGWMPGGPPPARYGIGDLSQAGLFTAAASGSGTVAAISGTVAGTASVIVY